ncbi:hypothetical protein ACFLTX_03480 [Chloroflexota bacterium]
MFWNIFRPRYWILDRQIRGMKPAVIIALMIILGYGGQFIYDKFIIPFLEILNTEQAISTIGSALPFGFVFFILFGMLGVGDVMSQLYLVSDLELLRIAPIPYRTIYLVKLLQCSRSTWVPVLVIGAILTLFGAAQNAPAAYYGLIVLLLLAIMVLITTLVMILVVILARIIPAQLVRTWKPLILILVTFGLVLSYPLITNFLIQENLVSYIVRALQNPKELGLISAGFTGISLVLTLLGYIIFKVSFHEGWDRFHVTPTGRSQRVIDGSRKKDLSWMLKWLPSPRRHFLLKEWLEFRRNPRGPIMLLQPLVIIVMLLLPFLSNSSMIEYFSPFIFWFLAIALVMLLGTLPLSTFLMIVVEEGRNLALIRSTPISMSEMLKGKFWATWIPIVLSWTIILSVVGRMINYSLVQTGFLVLMMVFGLTGVSLITISIVGLKADFSIDELKQRVSSQISLLIIGLNTIFMILTFLVFSWTLVHITPANMAVDMLRSFSNYAFISWLFSSSMWNLVILIAFQLGCWIGIWFVWNAAVHRLEEWEEGI